MKPGAILTDVKQQALLSQKISHLNLKIESTHLRDYILQLYEELEAAGVIFKPKTYLSNSWGCPNGVPVIGIPFYLADPVLCKLQTRMTGKEVEDDTTIMMLLRHEAGHTVNYAYRLYENPEWQQLFGRFSIPYQDKYEVDPYSNQFVHHLADYYAQKHPDDDFAETFAVWLTPYSNWQKDYTGTPALNKLMYVNKVLTRYGEESPVVTDGRLDMPVEEMSMTLSEWYENVYKNRNKRAAGPIIPTRKHARRSRK
jgi:hypothetical protein